MAFPDGFAVEGLALLAASPFLAPRWEGFFPRCWFRCWHAPRANSTIRKDIQRAVLCTTDLLCKAIGDGPLHCGAMVGRQGWSVNRFRGGALWASPFPFPDGPMNRATTPLGARRPSVPACLAAPRFPFPFPFRDRRARVGQTRKMARQAHMGDAMGDDALWSAKVQNGLKIENRLCYTPCGPSSTCHR